MQAHQRFSSAQVGKWRRIQKYIKENPTHYAQGMYSLSPPSAERPCCIIDIGCYILFGAPLLAEGKFFTSLDVKKALGIEEDEFRKIEYMYAKKWKEKYRTLYTEFENYPNARATVAVNYIESFLTTGEA